MPEIPPSPNLDDDVAKLNTEFEEIQPTLQSSTVPESIPLTHQETGAADLSKPAITIKRGEGSESLKPFPPIYETLLTQIDEMSDVYDLYPLSEELHQSHEQENLVGEYYDQLKTKLAEKMTTILVRAAKASSMDSELIKGELLKTAKYSYLSEEQRKQVENAIASRSEFNLATASLDKINEKFRSGEFSLKDIEEITDPTYLMFIMESIQSQLKGGSGELAPGVNLVRAVAERMQAIQNPAVAAMLRMYKTMEGFVKFK